MHSEMNATWISLLLNKAAIHSQALIIFFFSVQPPLISEVLTVDTVHCRDPVTVNPCVHVVICQSQLTNSQIRKKCNCRVNDINK